MALNFCYVLLVSFGIASALAFDSNPSLPARIRAYQRFLYGSGASQSFNSYYKPSKFSPQFVDLYIGSERDYAWNGSIEVYSNTSLSGVLAKNYWIHLSENMPLLARVHRFFWNEHKELMTKTFKGMHSLNYCFLRHGSNRDMFQQIELHYQCCSQLNQKICASTGRKCPHWEQPTPVCLTDLAKVWSGEWTASNLTYERSWNSTTHTKKKLGAKRSTQANKIEAKQGELSVSWQMSAISLEITLIALLITAIFFNANNADRPLSDLVGPMVHSRPQPEPRDPDWF